MPTSRTAAVAGLCATEDQELIDETFKFMMKEARDQDVFMFFAFLAQKRVVRRQVVKYLKEHYDEIYERFSGNTSLPHLIEYTFKYLTTESDAEDMEKFFKGKDLSKFNLVYHQTIDTIRSNAALLKRSNDDVTQWLERWSNSLQN